jgi:curved DNA-binding protein CbpA
MSAQTHYETMGFAQNASTAVIKAAYKALALVHHPDKTLHLDASQRAEHAAVFRAVQEAYDVLGNDTLRAQYDFELDRHGKVDMSCSTFHVPSGVRTPNGPAGYNRRSSSFTSPPETKAMAKARIELQLRQLQEIRAQRELEETSMDVTVLRQTLAIWREMAMEHIGDAVLSAHCKAKVQKYEQKLRMREAEHTAWLNNLASPKGGVPSGSTTQRSSPSRNSRRDSARASAKAEERRRTEENRAEEEARRARDRVREKARRDGMRQAQQEAKEKAVRAEEKQQRLADEAAAKKAAHIAKVRAKAAPGPATSGRSTPTQGVPSGNTIEVKKAPGRAARQCGRCNLGHVSVADWKRCIALSGSEQKAGEDDEAFFIAI